MVSAANPSSGVRTGEVDVFDRVDVGLPGADLPKSRWDRAFRLWAPDGEPLGRHVLQAGVMVLLAITALSGPVKQVLPAFPIDVTLAATVLSFVTGVVYALLSGRWPSSRQLAMLGLFLLMALAGASTVVPTDYGQLKVERLLTVTFVAAVAAVLPIHHQRDMMRFLAYLGAVALSLSVWIAITGENQYGAGGRLTTQEGSTIPYGRAAGYVLVLTVAWLLTSRRLTMPRLVGAGAVIGISVWTMVAIASRGPIQAVVMAIAAMLLLQVIAIETKVVWRAGISLLVLAGGLLALWETIPIQSRERVTETSGGASADARAYAWDVTWRALEVSPIGTGWGSFARLREADLLTYPHNLFLEVWFEAGIIGLVALLLLVYSSLRHQVRVFTVDRTAATIGTGAAVYWLASAMVSGDVNDNKAMWMVLVVVVAAASPHAVPVRRPAVQEKATVAGG